MPLADASGIQSWKVSAATPAAIVTDCSRASLPASPSAPPKKAQPSPVAAPAKPQAALVQIGVPKPVEDSVQDGLGVPASKPPSPTRPPIGGAAQTGGASQTRRTSSTCEYQSKAAASGSR